MRRVINIKHKMPAMAMLALAGASMAAVAQLPASSPARDQLLRAVGELPVRL